MSYYNITKGNLWSKSSIIEILSIRKCDGWNDNGFFSLIQKI